MKRQEIPGEEPPRLWKTWQRFYAVLLIYWFVLVVLMIIGTRVLNT